MSCRHHAMVGITILIADVTAKTSASQDFGLLQRYEPVGQMLATGDSWTLIVSCQPLLRSAMTALATHTVIELKLHTALRGRYGVRMTSETCGGLVGGTYAHSTSNLLRLLIQQNLIRVAMWVKLRPRRVFVLQGIFVRLEWLTRAVTQR